VAHHGHGILTLVSFDRNDVTPLANTDHGAVHATTRRVNADNDRRSHVFIFRPFERILDHYGRDELVFAGGGELGLGNTLLLGVNARGIAPLAYQWRRNGAPLAGATAASYTNRAVALGDAGSYDVVVGNSLGSVTSAPVAVTVVVRPGAVITSFPTNANTTRIAAAAPRVPGRKACPSP
jgi:hypothetical protein